MHRLKNRFAFLCAGSEQVLYDSGTQKYKHVLLPVCDAVDECKSEYTNIENIRKLLKLVPQEKREELEKEFDDILQANIES